MSNAVTNAILDFLNANPAADNEAVAAHVRRSVPGSTTTAASVSSVKSRLKREGHSFQRAPNAAYQPTDEHGEPLPPSVFVRPTVAFGAAALPATDESETLEAAKERIAVRYDAMERMTRRLVAGKVPSLIISGPPGLGKSYTVREALAERFPDGPEKTPDLSEDELDVVDDETLSTEGQLHYDTVSGSISAVGLYQALWYTRNGGILVLDDVDDVFRDETALNLLKGALDSSPVRTISWRKEARWLEENGIPDRFQFNGHVVFLTNIDFEQVIMSGKRDAEHFKALIDRSMYLCLTLRTRRDFMIRIRQVAGGEEGMLVKNFGLTLEQSEEVLDFVTEHQTRFYNLSLRLVGQVALCMAADPVAWQKDVEATKMRTM